jgi:NADH:ubiquinone oxidoreductase subunit 4 (subunit M)
MLLAFLALAYHAGTTDFDVLTLYGIGFGFQGVLWIAIFASLAVKTPLLPGHI